MATKKSNKSTSNFSGSDETIKFKAFAEERITPVPASFERVSVEVNLTAKVLSTYKRELYAEWQNAVQFIGRELNFTEGELSDYIDMIIQLRVNYVNGFRVPILPTDLLAVPSFLSVVLSNLGLARDDSFGIELYPVIKKRVEINQEFMYNMSRKIKVLKTIGVEYAEGYDRSRDGSYDFMTMTLIDGYVRTWTRDSHPVFALLSSTLELKGIEAVLSPRINYGHVDHMVSLIRHMAAVKG